MWTFLMFDNSDAAVVKTHNRQKKTKKKQLFSRPVFEGLSSDICFILEWSLECNIFIAVLFFLQNEISFMFHNLMVVTCMDVHVILSCELTL